ncbi:hypothetical protein OPV22_026456 [Ensete ventricosum]|uniref:Xaa-Pro dipeptidyl-peptidase-like domain-containing protein n=1 Tax=Ensete ventricosum TaxID=4639 RepID=A0AAV8QGQ2_ENSVE|nr:hypothetical protein OPV22_026456 [Ensete ventricosum]
MESVTVETSDGVTLHMRLFKPSESPTSDLLVVLVHPYTVLGGFQGLLLGVATGLVERGYRAVTFDMRGAGRSSGRPSLAPLRSRTSSPSASGSPIPSPLAASSWSAPPLVPQLLAQP